MTLQLATARTGAGRRPSAAIPFLLLGLALLGLIFRPEIVAAVSTWSGSTTYNHCFLVPAVAAWLAYDRRYLLPGLPVRPLPWTAVLAVPLALVWLASERLGIMEGRQVIALASAELLVLAVLGWPLIRAFAAPLLYLVFLIPFGAFLTTPLQNFTVAFITHGLDLLGIANFSDGYTIEIPEGVFFVAQACAGLRFLIAAIAFGSVYAVLLYRSPWRRLAFIAACVVAPVLANGLRTLGIVVAGHLIGSAEAAAADHLIYGWLFFSMVLALLIAAGLPFRQDGQPRVPPRSLPPVRPSARRMALAAIPIALLSAAGPLMAGSLDHAAAEIAAAAPATLPGCVAAAADGSSLDAGLEAARRTTLAGAGATAGRFVCAEGKVRLAAVAFPPRTNPMLILRVQRLLTGQTEAEDVRIARFGDIGATEWERVETTSPDRLSATALWIGGAPASGGLASRLRQARNSILGATRPVILAVAESADGGPLAPRLAAANRAGLSAQLAAGPRGGR